jgi:hypothetical protein
MWLLLTLKRQKQSNPCSSCRRCFYVRSKLYLRTCILQYSCNLCIFLDKYRPYYPTWNWGIIRLIIMQSILFRYRNNINICLNINNNYNYVNYRRSERAVVLYSSRRSNGYEETKSKLFFSRRNTNVTNRYELDQRRGSRNEIVNSNGRTNSQRGYTQNRTSSSEKQLHKEEL